MAARDFLRDGLTVPRRLGLAWGGTVGWLIICAVGLLGMTGGEAHLDPVHIIAVPVMVFGPVAVIWLAAKLSRRIDALTRTVAALGQGGVPETDALGPVLQRLDRIAAGQQGMQASLSRLSAQAGPAPTPTPRPVSAQRPSAQAARPAEPRPSGPELDLSDAQEVEPLPVSDLLSALQFPADPSDKEGFRALRAAMRDHEGRQIVMAAQDALTLLSQDGLYMDDFAPGDIDADAWRRFGQGERGAGVETVGGIRDEEAVEIVAARLRADAIFRDVCHHFVRFFDRLLARLEPQLSDEELAAMTDTRTGRAFMLIGRAMGTFD